MKALLITGLGIVLVFLSAVITGTILWIIWDDCIPYVFPALVNGGYLASDLSWWQAVTLTWISNILLKSSFSSNGESKK